MKVEFAVIDDYGDNWRKGQIAFKNESYDACVAWAENENYHSASIVRIEDGKRVQCIEDEFD